MSPAIGYALREQNRHILDDTSINAVEITFERADDPLRIERYIGDLDFDVVGVHALKLSVGSPEPPGSEYLEALKSIAIENGASSVSDHLGFTRSGHHGVEMGHFAPPPFTSDAMDTVCRNVDLIQQYFGDTRFYLENIASLFHFEGTMTEAEFLAGVVRRSGCGLLLDVTNVFANASNFGFDGFEFIESVVAEADSIQIHLAGGFFDESEAMYVDSHSHPIPNEVWRLYRHALKCGRDRIEAVFIERDQNFPDDDGWRSEIQLARTIAEENETIAIH